MTDLLTEWLEQSSQLTFTSGLVLGTIFVVAAFVLVPRTVLLLGAGAAFGLKGLPIVFVSTTLGSILAFLAARYVAADWFQRKLQKRRLLSAVASAVDEEGWRVVALFRFAGPLPNAIQNYAFGLTRIKIATYSIVTFVFSIPQVTLYSYLGATGRASLLDNESLGLSRGILCTGVIVALVIIWLISVRVRFALDQLKDLKVNADS